MTGWTEIPQSVAATSVAGGGFSLSSIYEVNERCLELLVYAARTSPAPPFSLVLPIRDLLLQLTPELRKHVAGHGFLLTDFEFRNVEWWTAIRQFPEKQFRGTAWRSPFAKRSAIPLTRATLMLAWQAVRTNRPTACTVLGVANSVADMIGTLRLTEIDRIADRHHRHLEPRWADRPGVWHALLAAASAPSPPSKTQVDAYGLQLSAGDFLPPIKAARPQGTPRLYPVLAHREI